MVERGLAIVLLAVVLTGSSLLAALAQDNCVAEASRVAQEFRDISSRSQALSRLRQQLQGPNDEFCRYARENLQFGERAIAEFDAMGARCKTFDLGAFEKAQSGVDNARSSYKEARKQLSSVCALGNETEASHRFEVMPGHSYLLEFGHSVSYVYIEEPDIVTASNETDQSVRLTASNKSGQSRVVVFFKDTAKVYDTEALVTSSVAGPAPAVPQTTAPAAPNAHAQITNAETLAKKITFHAKDACLRESASTVRPGWAEAYCLCVSLAFTSQITPDQAQAMLTEGQTPELNRIAKEAFEKANYGCRGFK